ncbi:MAG TPA: cysteine desulfurase family protein, partial [Roseimicrobium sp.]|nr:cysteine desulfurase family protein [Roseimicrobium sp.]
MRQIYLDHQASTSLLPEALDAMLPYLRANSGNPSSLHQAGLNARQALDLAREQFASFLNAASTEEILFTGNGTEAVNLAIKGIAYASQRQGRHLVVSAIEHPAVLRSVEFLEKQGFSCTRVAVGSTGLVDPQSVKAAIRDDTVLIAVHHVNHDLGTVEPVAAIGVIAAEKGIPLVVDAVAGAGWLETDVQALGAACAVISPNRFYGPKGVGVLYRNRRARLQPLIQGGSQEGGLRAGTENVAAIVGAGLAASVAARDLQVRQKHVAALQRLLWEGIQKRVSKVALFGPEIGAFRSPANLNISALGTEGEGQLLSLDLKGIAVASGSSCLGRSMAMP